jgi:hypothetical protein
MEDRSMGNRAREGRLMKLIISFVVISLLFFATTCMADDKEIIAVYGDAAQEAESGQSAVSFLIPVSVEETTIPDGARQIIRTYELTESESPKDIDTRTFERGGFEYQLAEIVKKETTGSNGKTYSEVITINTKTKDIDTILTSLAKEMPCTTEDGYTGVLQLDISSIVVESAGVKATTYTITAMREYPYLSRNDTSLIPKTVEDQGRTLTLVDVAWTPQNSDSIDGQNIPSSYNALAKYSTDAKASYVTGYITTAAYTGELIRVKPGKTTYAAYFTGKTVLPVRTAADATGPIIMIIFCTAALTVLAMTLIKVVRRRIDKKNNPDRLIFTDEE